jgi:hypothetical protein
LDHLVPELESLSHGELVVLAREQAVVIERQDAQIAGLGTQLAVLLENFETQAAEVERLRHLLSRNSSNSSMPPSGDDGPGRTPPRKQLRAKPSGRSRGKQPGAPGAALRWLEADELGDREDRYPEGVCACGADLADAVDLGVVDRYQQHEIPLVSVKVTQYDQHASACSCGKVHTAKRPGGRRGRP